MLAESPRFRPPAVEHHHNRASECYHRHLLFASGRIHNDVSDLFFIERSYSTIRIVHSKMPTELIRSDEWSIHGSECLDCYAKKVEIKCCVNKRRVHNGLGFDVRFVPGRECDRRIHHNSNTMLPQWNPFLTLV